MKSTSSFDSDDFVRQIARYNQELIQASRRSAFPSFPDTPDGDNSNHIIRDEEAPNDRFETPPAPDTSQPEFENDSPSEPERIDEQPKEPVLEDTTDYAHDSTGYLQIQTFTAREAMPVEGAAVTVYEKSPEGDRFVTLVKTDNSGFTPVISLPTVNARLSQKPGFPEPYTVYSVTVSADGFYRVKSENIPIFSNIVSRQPVSLIPLPDREDGRDYEIVYSEVDFGELN